MPAEIFSRRSCNDTGQGQQSNDVRDGHKSVENIGDGPHGGNRQVGADEHGGDIDPAIDLHGQVAAVGEVLHAALGVVVPAQDGGEGEEHQYKMERISPYPRRSHGHDD